MISAQLGRIVLGGSESTIDEMSAKPDDAGRYGPLDGLLEEAAGRLADRADRGGRPGRRASVDRPDEVSQPSG